MAGKRFLSWDEYMKMVRQLAVRLEMSARPFDKLRAIPRGGLVPAVYLSHHLDTPLGREFVDPGLHELTSDTVLVDDILDSGRTMSKAVDCGPPGIIAVVVAKPAGVEAWRKHVEDHVESTRVPELIVGHVHEGNDWLVFPYENQEQEERDEAHQEA